MKENEIVEEKIGLADKEREVARKIRLMAQKLLEIVISLPDEVIVKYQLTPTQLDEIFKPLTQKLYLDMAENDLSIENLEDSIELIASTETFTMKRIINYFDLTIKYVYKNLIGYEDPFKEMSVGEWEKRRNDFAKSEELSTGTK
jgi:hypothetical protein